MFQVNDVVVYGAQGVCQIVGIDRQTIKGASKTYFVLKPKDGRTAVFYVPTWNEKALAKLRKVMTKTELDSLIDSMPSRTPIWIQNENERREAYRIILASGDQSEIIAMMQAIFLQKKEREAQGKRLHVSDESFMRDAEQLLYNEWQYVLNLDKDGLLAYIFERIENQK